MQQKFVNPANGDTYIWRENHSTEDVSGKARTITDTANSAGTGRVRQQGDDGSMTIKLHGTLTTRDQNQQFWKWYQLCRTQTIYFTDFDGQEYEVQITSYQPQRVANMTRIRRDATMTHHHFTYELDMEIYAFRSGDLLTAGVLP